MRLRGLLYASIRSAPTSRKKSLVPSMIVPGASTCITHICNKMQSQSRNGFTPCNDALARQCSDGRYMEKCLPNFGSIDDAAQAKSVPTDAVRLKLYCMRNDCSRQLRHSTAQQTSTVKRNLRDAPTLCKIGYTTLCSARRSPNQRMVPKLQSSVRWGVWQTSAMMRSIHAELFEPPMTNSFFGIVFNAEKDEYVKV